MNSISTAPVRMRQSFAARCASRWAIRITATLFCLLAVQGCAAGGMKVSGRVVDAETGQPIAGAYVYGQSGHDNHCPFELGSCRFIVDDAALTRTDASGHYVFQERFNFGGTFTSKSGRIIVYKPGYVSAPKMVDQSWDYQAKGIGTPKSFVATTIVSQYFYGTGNYRDDYRDNPLNQNSKNYYLSSTSIRELSPYSYQFTPRLVYLLNVIGGLSSGNKAISKLKRAMYQEAKLLAQNKDDQKITHEICLEAYDLSTTNSNTRCPP
ncbi:MAG TPA: hypothetical protein VFJ08_12705 [Salinisphaera sp.]|nr:hypothetical protein [Salinisphaera sp.]